LNWEYKKALNDYKPSLEEHLALKKLKPTLNALIQYADDFCIVEVGVRAIAKDLNKTPNTISEHISKLSELGFIKTLDIKGNFGKKNTRLLTLPNVQHNVSDDVSVNVSDDVSNDVSNDVSPMTDTEERKKRKVRSNVTPKGMTKSFKDALDVAKYLSDAILEIQPTAKKPSTLNGWAKDIELAIRIDKRDPELLKGCIDWIFREEGKQQDFWKPIIRSGKNLRRKFDTLETQAQNTRG